LFAVVYTYFAVSFISDFLKSHRMSSLLIVLIEGLLALFYIGRRFPTRVSVSPYAWLVAGWGTWGILMIRPAGSSDLLVGQCFLMVGLFLQVYALASLNRSLGIVPANRGIQTKGLYRWIRHPLYTTYFVTFTGMLINHFSTWNLAIALLMVACQLSRISCEERLLCEDPKYREYMSATRWRLIPFVY
jgi:protein-S-isoprenylcysteine O-methyltransferase Ste14